MVLGIAVGIVMTVGVALWAHSVADNTHDNQQFQTVSARTLRIVDSQGHARFVIGAPLPNPVIQGKELPRSSPVVGIQFLDSQGNETGGLAIIDRVQGAALCFDYSTGDPGEAMRFTKAGDYKGITLLDPPAPGGQLGVSGNSRIEMSLDKGMPRLALSDRNGKDRLVLTINNNGNPQIESFDANGKAIVSSTK
jgi:hypothetical protein